MKRWIIRSFSILSLLLCMVTAVLWVRSYWWADSIMLGGEDRPNRIFSSVPGKLSFTSINGCLYSDRFHWYSSKMAGEFDASSNSWSGFKVWSDSITVSIHLGSPPMSRWGVGTPYWFPFLLTGSLPTLWLTLFVWRRRKENGRAFPVELAKPKVEP